MIRSISLEAVKPLNCDWSQAGPALRKAKKAAAAAANMIQTHLLRLDKAFDKVRYKDGKISIERKADGKIDMPKLDNVDQRLYEEIRKRFPFLSARLINYLVRDVRQRYMAARFEILIGKRSAPTYRQYSLQSDQCSLEMTDDGIVLSFALFSKESDLDCPRRINFLMKSWRLKGQHRSIIESIAKGDRKLKSVRLRFLERKRKWMVSFPYETDGVVFKMVEGRVLEVSPPGNGKILRASCFPKGRNIKNKEDVWFEDLEFDSAIAFRKAYDRRIRNMSRKYRQDSSTGGKGHGRTRALKNKTAFQDKYKRACRTFNQQRAAHIIKLAVRWRCSSIEFLCPADVKLDGYNLLESWPWYQLEECIRNKAEEHGVEFRKVEFDGELFEDIAAA